MGVVGLPVTGSVTSSIMSSFHWSRSMSVAATSFLPQSRAVVRTFCLALPAPSSEAPRSTSRFTISTEPDIAARHSGVSAPGWLGGNSIALF